jgi:hypothetical protein
LVPIEVGDATVAELAAAVRGRREAQGEARCARQAQLEEDVAALETDMAWRRQRHEAKRPVAHK